MRSARAPPRKYGKLTWPPFHKPLERSPTFFNDLPALFSYCEVRSQLAVGKFRAGLFPGRLAEILFFPANSEPQLHRNRPSALGTKGPRELSFLQSRIVIPAVNLYPGERKALSPWSRTDKPQGLNSDLKKQNDRRAGTFFHLPREGRQKPGSKTRQNCIFRVQPTWPDGGRRQSAGTRYA